MARLGVVIAIVLAGVLAVELRHAPAERAELTVALPTDIFTLDPQRMSVDYDFEVGFCLFEGLVRWDKDTLEPAPALAESWSVSPDGLVWTFRLRGGARWSNGDPVRAGDFVFAWRRALLADSAADYTQALFVIDGAEGFLEWRGERLAEYASLPAERRTPERAMEEFEAAKRRFEETVGVRAEDDLTLELRLGAPSSILLDLLCLPVALPVHPPTLERFTSVDGASGQVRTRTGWTKPGALVGNGPYALAERRFKRDLLLRRSPTYRDPGAVRAGSVRIVVVSNPNTAVLTYETGGVDWLPEALVDYLPGMIAESDRGERKDLRRTERFGTYFWSFNCRPALSGGGANPFHDERVRRAFAMATNKRDIVEKIRRVGDRATDALIPRGSITGYDADGRVNGVGHDPAGARELLARAGWRDRDADGIPEDGAGTPFPTVELLCSTGSYHERVALALGQMWEDALGVRSRVAAKESKVFNDDLGRGSFMVARGFWFGDYADPTTFLSINRTGDGNNDRGFSDAEFDALLAGAEREGDPAARMQLLEQAERIITERALPLLPIFHPSRASLFDPERVEGVSKHGRLLQHYWTVEVKRPGARADGGGP